MCIFHKVQFSKPWKFSRVALPDYLSKTELDRNVENRKQPSVDRTPEK